ncbi:DegT/DnrJ/EryC1/StrS family aminotransferase [Candidatus Sumerlaeota bacterium]|nr:DegT/DnrJ/EryC1/StrS family aminotransferase [Candidatus Sumerlaeota bacterium]
MFEIPLTETTLDEEEVEAATRVLRSKWLTMGAEVAAFEQEFAAAIGTREAIAVSNGTVALELSLRALGLGQGDEVILPTITFIACLNAVRLCGATAVLADVTSEDDLTISIEDVKRKITERTCAIIPMAHSGFPPDMTALMRLANGGRNIAVIEDGCHAPLAEIAGRKIGAFGIAGCWSFFGNKNMTTGEGGMITTNDPDFAARVRLMRSHGITKTTWDRARGHASSYDVALVGTNARMDEVRAAIGRVQLRKLPGANEGRRNFSGQLRAALAKKNITGLVIPFTRHQGTSSHHLLCVLLPEDASRDRVMDEMKSRGVQTSIHYPPLNGFGGTRSYFESGKWVEELPVTKRIAGRILTLPLSPTFEQQVAERVATALDESVKAAR